jgi:TonB family protein
MKTIYLADRDEAYRKELAHELQQGGAQVVEFASGPELFARTVENEPDLVLMDTDLDEVDGFQVFVWLQRERPHRPYPVVFLTRFDHPGVARVCKHHGALDYLLKSDPLEQVTDRIQRILARRDRPHERELPVALECLRSQGKSGRLDVTAYGEDGYVLLYKGRTLEARWNFFEGDQALRVLMQVPLEARFRFTEWFGETSRPEGDEGEGVAPTPEVGPQDLAGDSEAAPAAAEIATVPAAVESAPVSTATEIAPAPEEAEVPDAGKNGKRDKPVSRRALLGLLIALPLLVTVGLALSALFPGVFPGRDEIRSVLSVPVGARKAQEGTAPQGTASLNRPIASSPDAPAGEGRASPGDPPDGDVPLPSVAELPSPSQVQSAPEPMSQAIPPGTTPAQYPAPAVRADAARPGTKPPPALADSPTTVRKTQRSARLIQRSLLFEEDTDPPGLESQPASGSLLLDIEVGGNGRAKQVQIRRSSGNEAADQAAMAAARKVLWEPADGERGATGAWITLAVAFDPPQSNQSDSPADSSERGPAPPPPEGDLALKGLAAERVATPSPEPSRPESEGIPDSSLNLAGVKFPVIRGGSLPSPKGSLRVRYPRELADKKVRGAATLRVLVGASGSVEAVRVLRSSGHPELDRALEEAVRRMSYHPARRRDGRAVPAWIEQRVLGVCCRAPASSP